MKKIFTLISIFLVILTNGSCISEKKIFTASYTFEFDQKNSESQIASILLNSVVYKVTTDGNFLYISTNFSNPEKDNFQVVNSGASEAIFDIKENIVSFDKKTDSVFNFKNISLRGLAKKEVFEGYKCNLFVTERGDTLYISNSLPYYVNPFFLNKESIKNGIVKATIVKVGTYSISGLMKNSGKPITGFKITEKTKINQVENIFFK